MKRIIQNILMLIAFASMSSCLKDKPLVGPDADNSAGAIIEWANPDFIASGSASGAVKLARYAVTVTKGTASPLHVRVNYVGTAKTAPTDVTVTLGVDAAAVDAHNTQSGRTTAANMFVNIPTSWYTLPATVIIPKGSTGIDLTIPVNTNNFLSTTPAKNLYVIPLSIKGSTEGTISGNFGTIIVNILAP